MYVILHFLSVLVLFSIVFFVLHLIYLFKQNQKYIDIDMNDEVLVLCISNKVELCNKLNVFPVRVNIDDILPPNIDISYDVIKECGLYSKMKYKKGDIVYRFPLYRYPKGNIVISTPFGDRDIRPEIHTSVLCNKYGIFTGFDCFINHNNRPNVDYDVSVCVEDQGIFMKVYALRDINIGDELLIDYHKGLCNPFVFLWKTIIYMYGFEIR